MPLVWTLVGLAATFVIGELVARVALKRLGRHYPLRPHVHEARATDREALPMLEPVVRWDTNADGERGDAYRPGAWRGLLIGGSCVESYYLDQPSSVGEQLRAALASNERRQRLGAADVHVGSVARSLISCHQIERMLAPDLGRYGKLDCAVLLVGASDMVRWFELGTPTEPLEPTHRPKGFPLSQNGYGFQVI